MNNFCWHFLHIFTSSSIRVPKRLRLNARKKKECGVLDPEKLGFFKIWVFKYKMQKIFYSSWIAFSATYIAFSSSFFLKRCRHRSVIFFHICDTLQSAPIIVKRFLSPHSSIFSTIAMRQVQFKKIFHAFKQGQQHNNFIEAQFWTKLRHCCN